jgi:hypothetical protein
VLYVGPCLKRREFLIAEMCFLPQANGVRGMGDAWPCPLDADKGATLAKTRARVPAQRLRRKPSGRVAPAVETEEQRAKRKRWGESSELSTLRDLATLT